MGASGRRYTAEFRAEAVKQVIDRGHPVREVAARLGVSAWSLYEWLRAHRQAGSPMAAAAQDSVARSAGGRDTLLRPVPSFTFPARASWPVIGGMSK